MKKMNVRELEITKEMYNRAKEIEDIYEQLRKWDCRTKEFKKLQNKVIDLEDKFEEEISDEFLSLEIVNEYERRERNSDSKIKKSEVKMTKNLEEIELLKKIGVIPQWATGMKKTKGSIWTKKFTDVGYKSTGWRFCDRYGDWWDEYSSGKEFIYAEQCIRYTEKF